MHHPEASSGPMLQIAQKSDIQRIYFSEILCFRVLVAKI